MSLWWWILIGVGVWIVVSVLLGVWIGRAFGSGGTISRDRRRDR